VTNINFKDSLILEKLLTDSLKSDVSQIINRDRQPKLRVEIDATHSGTIINNRVYPGIHVKDGYKSFISKERGGSSEYDKPILKHHDLTDDPIGRIVDARYSQLKSGEDFEYDFLTPDANGSKGSGIVTVTALITDSESIKKIVDSRYLSVSAGHSSRSLHCSTCGDSILECSHIPGKTYNDEGESDPEGRMCWAVTGPMTYHEVSFVNLPASPSAKLTNFSWQDSKEEWCKKDNIIASQTLGKKEAVRNLVLSDEEGELSLISNKYVSNTKKTVIAVSPAIADKLKHVISSDKSTSKSEPSNGHIPEKNSKEVLTVEQNLDKAKNLDNKSKEDQKMDVTLETLQAELSSLKDQLSTVKTENEALKNQVTTKDNEIVKLEKDAKEGKAAVSKSLALCLASLRSNLNKVDSELIDSDEKFNKYVDSLATRTIESLQDSITDLMSDKSTKVTKPSDNGTPADKIISGDKINSPVMSKSKDGKPVKDEKNNNKKSKSGLDASFGLS
jgi:hypothetical protein